jgi:hypothetical protein
MKIALNKCFGGFSLSRKCLELIFELLYENEKKALFNFHQEFQNKPFKYAGTFKNYLSANGFIWYPKYCNIEFRTNPKVISCIERL